MALVFGLTGACSSGDPAQGTPTSTAGATSSPSGTANVAGSATTAGSSGGGVANSSGGAGAGAAAGGGAGQTTSAGSSGASGSASGGSGGAPVASGELYKGPFTCSMYIGAYLSMEWWNAGFQDGVDDAKWQLKWHHHGHITEWAKPDSPFWADTGNPLDDAQGSPIESKCTQNSDKPDRIVLLVISWALTTEDTWVAALNADIANLKTKYPSVKRVDLMTMIRCPMNMQCNPNQMYGIADSDTNAGHQDCQVPPYADSAIAKVIAANPSYVALGPQFEMTMCNPSHDGAHMTGADNKIAATKIATFYAAQP
jgi:hypothetical protein